MRNQASDAAVPLLEKLVALDAKDARARVDLGAAYAATGDRERAARMFAEALKLRPADASALMGLANLHLKNGEEEQAIALLRNAVKSVPNAFEPRFLLGSAYNRLGRYEQAIQELQSALRLGGAESPEIHYQLARAYGGAGRQDDRRAALAVFAEVTRKSKQSTEDHRTARHLADQAKSLIESGDVLAAAAKMEEARELRPGDAQILFRLAGIYFDLRQYEKSREYAQEAISLAPTEWLHHYLLGLTETRAGHWQQARRSLEVAVKLNPSAAEAHNALGEVALQENNPRLAIAGFERATQLDPQQAAYRVNLEAAQRAAGRTR